MSLSRWRVLARPANTVCAAHRFGSKLVRVIASTRTLRNLTVPVHIWGQERYFQGGDSNLGDLIICCPWDAYALWQKASSNRPPPGNVLMTHTVQVDMMLSATCGGSAASRRGVTCMCAAPRGLDGDTSVPGSHHVRIHTCCRRVAAGATSAQTTMPRHLDESADHFGHTRGE